MASRTDSSRPAPALEAATTLSPPGTSPAPMDPTTCMIAAFAMPMQLDAPRPGLPSSMASLSTMMVQSLASRSLLSAIPAPKTRSFSYPKGIIATDTTVLPAAEAAPATIGAIPAPDRPARPAMTITVRAPPTASSTRAEALWAAERMTWTVGLMTGAVEASMPRPPRRSEAALLTATWPTPSLEAASGASLEPAPPAPTTTIGPETTVTARGASGLDKKAFRAALAARAIKVF